MRYASPLALGRDVFVRLTAGDIFYSRRTARNSVDADKLFYREQPRPTTLAFAWWARFLCSNKIVLAAATGSDVWTPTVDLQEIVFLKPALIFMRAGMLRRPFDYPSLPRWIFAIPPDWPAVLICFIDCSKQMHQNIPELVLLTIPTVCVNLCQSISEPLAASCVVSHLANTSALLLYNVRLGTDAASAINIKHADKQISARDGKRCTFNLVNLECSD